jgi:hypothetical protein
MRYAPMRYTPVKCTPMNNSETMLFGGSSRRERPFNPENPPKNMVLSNAAYLRIQIQTLNYSSPFIIKFKCFICCDSGFQISDLKTLFFPGGEILFYPYKVPDLDGRERLAVNQSYAFTRLTPSYLSFIDILVA